MEEEHPLVGKEKEVSCTSFSSGLESNNAEDTGSKKQNCLCAPTTHAGSFRCRLHRRPPPSPLFSQHAVKKGLASQKQFSPKVKLAHHKLLKQGSGKRASSCSGSSRLQQELPGLSRLSRTSATKEQTSSFLSDQEALTTLGKTSGSGDEAHESSEANGEELSSAKKKNHIRPLVKLPSI